MKLMLLKKYIIILIQEYSLALMLVIIKITEFQCAIIYN
jgi:hypothetical protein